MILGLCKKRAQHGAIGQRLGCAKASGFERADRIRQHRAMLYRRAAQVREQIPGHERIAAAIGVDRIDGEGRRVLPRVGAGYQAAAWAELDGDGAHALLEQLRNRQVVNVAQQLCRMLTLCTLGGKGGQLGFIRE